MMIIIVIISEIGFLPKKLNHLASITPLIIINLVKESYLS